MSECTACKHPVSIPEPLLNVVTEIHTCEREELARIIGGKLITRSSMTETAAAVLAAGYTKPRQVTTPEALDALPDRTVIRTSAGSIVNLVGSRAYFFGYEASSSRRTLALPVTVLYSPVVAP